MAHACSGARTKLGRGGESTAACGGLQAGCWRGPWASVRVASVPGGQHAADRRCSLHVGAVLWLVRCSRQGQLAPRHDAYATNPLDTPRGRLGFAHGGLMRALCASNPPLHCLHADSLP